MAPPGAGNRRFLGSKWPRLGPDIVDFGGLNGPLLFQNPRKGGGLRPPPFPVDFAVGGGHLDPQHRRFSAPGQKPGRWIRLGARVSVAPMLGSVFLWRVSVDRKLLVSPGLAISARRSGEQVANKLRTTGCRTLSGASACILRARSAAFGGQSEAENTCQRA